jgi:protein-S-isoprenylcysteine O-methyltransferase Ste14
MCRPRPPKNFRRRERGKGSPVGTGPDGGEPTGAPEGRPQPPGTIRHWREREKPAASVIWQTVAIVIVGFAFAGALAALTLADNMQIRASELWIGAVAFALLSITCFLAHWDVNRGRRSRDVEIEERPAAGHD